MNTTPEQIVKTACSIIREANFDPMSTENRNAAWRIYLELATRTSCQPTTEQATDTSSVMQITKDMRSLTRATRKILRKQGIEASEVARAWIPVLNNLVYPLFFRWQNIANEANTKQFLEGNAQVFWNEMAPLQEHLATIREELAKKLELEPAFK